MSGNWWNRMFGVPGAAPMDDADERDLLRHLEETGPTYRQLWEHCVEEPDWWSEFDTHDIVLAHRASAMEHRPPSAAGKQWCFVILAKRDDARDADRRTFFIHGNGDKSRTPRDVALTHYVGGTPGNKDGQERVLDCASPADAIRSMLRIAREGFGLLP